MILVLFIFVACLLYYLWQRRHLLRLAGKLKGLKGYPIIGSAYKFLDANQILKVINDFHRDFGGPGKFWLGNRLFVYIDEPAHAETILNSPHSLNKGDSYNFISESIGLGLITLKSDEWRFHRKNLNPSFNYNIVKSFYPIFNKHLKIMVDNLKVRSGSGPFNIQDNIQACALDMLCETTLGFEVNTQTQSNPKFLHTAHNILDVTARRFFQPWIQPSWLFWLSKHHGVFRKSVHALNMLVGNHYESKKLEFAEHLAKLSALNESPDDTNNNGDETDKSAEKTIFIDRLVKLALEDKIFTDANVCDELKTVLLAGFETTATAVTNICVLLGIFQDYQQKLFDEIRSVVADQQADIDQADLANMPYLDAFIKEALRFFPVVPVLTRLLKEDMQLGDACIPKGTEYIMDIWNMHRIKDNWKFDAQLFNPENFFPQNAIQRHPYSYIPYSAGPRNCIGIKYANITLKLIVAYIVRQYRIKTLCKLEAVKFRMNVTLCLTNDKIFEIENRLSY